MNRKIDGLIDRRTKLVVLEKENVIIEEKTIPVLKKLNMKINAINKVNNVKKLRYFFVLTLYICYIGDRTMTIYSHLIPPISLRVDFRT